MINNMNVSKLSVKYSEMVYTPVDIDQWEDSFKKSLLKLKSTEDLEDKLESLSAINQLRNDFETMHVLASSRYDLNTEDEFYDAQNELFDKIMPRYDQAVDQLYEALLEDSLSEALEGVLGAHFFNLMRMKRSTFKAEVMPLLERENLLVSEYNKLRSSIRIEFDGKVLNIPQMEPYLQATDRIIRKSAHEALEAEFEKHANAFENNYSKLVKLRHEIALALGYQSFVPLAYARLNRSDYGPVEVESFRNAIREHLVPKLAPIYEDQRKRLGIESLQYYDLALEFLDGNPTPKGDSKWILEGGAKMYQELSPETHEFFQTMLTNELMDLEAKPGKTGGGYCSYIANYGAPFIFANFNGTMGDIDVLTHEAGHAYQVYQSRHHSIPEYLWPTLEACEIHSMSMEYLTYPYMERFFEEDTNKYFYAHMFGSIRFIPYGVLVDHFQHWVYENPDASNLDRRKAWRDLEKQYLPHKDYSENPFLESGTYWFRQGHIFMDPFYYIDYTLAAMCALQFWKFSLEDREKALESYNHLCQLGGSLPFTELLKSINLASPFDSAAVNMGIDRALSFVVDQGSKL